MDIAFETMFYFIKNFYFCELFFISGKTVVMRHVHKIEILFPRREG